MAGKKNNKSRNGKDDIKKYFIIQNTYRNLKN